MSDLIFTVLSSIYYVKCNLRNDMLYWDMLSAMKYCYTWNVERCIILSVGMCSDVVFFSVSGLMNRVMCYDTE